MTEQLIATHQGKRVGTLHHAQDVLSFRYEESWPGRRITAKDLTHHRTIFQSHFRTLPNSS